MLLLNKLREKALFLALSVIILLSGCGTVQIYSGARKIKHIYIAPVTNKTPEEGADIFFSKAADETFYTDARFMVDETPIPDETIVIKPSVITVSTYSVGYNINDQAVEYKVTVTAVIKLIKYGYKKPFKTLNISGYQFYSGTGAPAEIERRKKEAIEIAAKKIFRKLAEKLLEERESGKIN